MKFKMLPIDKILMNPGNPRMAFDDNFSGYEKIPVETIKLKQLDILSWYDLTADDDVSEDKELGRQYSYHRAGLRDSIEVEGIQDPIKVQELDNGQFLVVDGNTRLSIAKELVKSNEKFKEVPCFIISDYQESNFHKIQLTQHVVGSKPWDIFCRARYLHHLKKTNVMELNHILNICGLANKRKYKLEIASYEQMMEWKTICDNDSVEAVNNKNLQMWDTTRFSYFLEFQKKINIFNDIDYPPEEFNKHMRQNLIDKGADVRRLPDIWQNTDDPEKRIRKIYLEEGTQAAIKELDSQTKDNGDDSIINTASFLTHAINSMRNEEREKFMEEQGDKKIEILSGCSDELIDFIKDLERYLRISS